MGVILAVMEVKVRGRITKKLRVIANSEKEAAEKARLMLLNDFEVDPADIECEVQPIEGEFQDDAKPSGI